MENTRTTQMKLRKKEKINVNIKLSKLSCTYICVCYYVSVVHKVTSIMRCVISHFHKIMFYISYEGYNNFEIISNLKGDHQIIDQLKIIVTSIPRNSNKQTILSKEIVKKIWSQCIYCHANRFELIMCLNGFLHTTYSVNIMPIENLF